MASNKQTTMTGRANQYGVNRRRVLSMNAPTIKVMIIADVLSSFLDMGAETSPLVLRFKSQLPYLVRFLFLPKHK